MQKVFYFFNFRWLFLILALTSMEVQGRVGEERSKLEIRLFRSGGLQIKEDKLIMQKQKGVSYLKFEPYFPSSTEIRLYYKTMDGRRPKPSELENRVPEGWVLHVIYYKGVSVLEVYQKNGKIDEFEKNHLLDFQRENSFWVETSKEASIQTASCFQHDFIRNDQTTKAKILGNSSMIFFSSDFDLALARAKEEEQRKSAPDSIKGF